MIVLALDTSTSAGSVAILDHSKLLAELTMETNLTHSERVLPAIDCLLGICGLKIEDVDGFAVAAGPGSFTGIRIGMSTIKSLALASGKPVVPISTLEALASKVGRPRNRLVCPILDAKKGEVYGALFRAGGDGLEEIIAQGAYSPDRLFSLLPPRRVVTFIGSGAVVFREKIREYLGDKAHWTGRTPFVAHEIGLLGFRKFRAKQGLDAHQVEPLYFRKSQAEEGH